MNTRIPFDRPALVGSEIERTRKAIERGKLSGDEVVMPSYTFVSTANAVMVRVAVPVFADIDPVTLNIDPNRAAAAVTERPRAILAVHYAGLPADMGPLLEASFRTLHRWRPA